MINRPDVATKLSEMRDLATKLAHIIPDTFSGVLYAYTNHERAAVDALVRRVAVLCNEITTPLPIDKLNDMMHATMKDIPESAMDDVRRVDKLLASRCWRQPLCKFGSREDMDAAIKRGNPDFITGAELEEMRAEAIVKGISV